MKSSDPVSYFNSFPLFGSEDGFKPGLNRAKKLLDLANFSEEDLNFIHVAGSNGKGSTIVMLENIYQEAGYSVGRYISPHIEEFNERIRINGRNITRAELQNLAEILKPIIDEENNWSEVGSPTFFEVLTAAALLFFSQKKPEIAILETGLGGRLDATNVISSPLASIITSIDLEHTEYLGETLGEIAREKAGIIKQNSLVICGEEKAEPVREIVSKAAKEKAPVYFAGEYYGVKDWEETMDRQDFKLLRQNEELSIELKLLGEHQLKNAVTACTAVDVLQPFFSVARDDITRGLSQVSWPGRLEIVRGDPPFIIDGSHTPAGIKFLREFLNRNFRKYDKGTIILSVLRDKKLEEIVEELQKLDFNYEIILTSGRSSRALNPSDAPEKLQEQIQISDSKDLILTIKEALNNQGKDEFLCATGSLHSVLDIKEAFASNKIRLN